MIMRRTAVVLGLAAGVALLSAAPASARACQGDAVGLDVVTKGIKAEAGPTALRDVGGFNSWLAHEKGGLHFGPDAKAWVADCR